jgi:hypothetical protein
MYNWIMDFNEIDFDPRTMTMATPAEVAGIYAKIWRKPMSRTLAGNTTGRAAQIEAAEFQESFAQRALLTIMDRVRVMVTVLESLLSNAHAFPEFSAGLLDQAEKVQKQIADMLAELGEPTPHISGGEICYQSAPTEQSESTDDEFPF